MKVESRYKIKKTRNILVENTGYSYNGRMLIDSLNNNIFKNQNLLEFLQKIEKILNEAVYQVKTIKKFYNPWVDKDSDLIN
jgi:exo-beta-1,3-glucanase (GH17 family)